MNIANEMLDSVRDDPNLLQRVITSDEAGMVHHEVLPQCRTVNKEYYLKVMRNLREAIRQKRPDLWKNKNWLLHHDNAPAHTSLLVRDFLAKNNTLMMPQPPYSPDLAPCSLRSEILSRIHEGHQGVTKSRRRMRENVYWPKSYKDVEQMVLNCNECIKERISRERETVILHTKSIFARHGIPELVRTDNGPQFKNYLFQNFGKRYGFRHITSSPKYLQNNGMTESAVKMIKARLKKSHDPYLGLLAYRTTPLENGFSPSELLMGTKLRSDLPTHPDLLKLTLVNQGLLNQKEYKYRERERRSYNNHWKVRNQKEFDVGDRVWVRDLKVPGTIIGRANQPRSYFVKSPKGQLRRNKIHLALNYKHKVSRECEENIPEVTQVDIPQSSEQGPSSCEVEQQEPSSCEVEFQQDYQGLLGEGGTSRPYITRTGRVVKPPASVDVLPTRGQQEAEAGLDVSTESDPDSPRDRRRGHDTNLDAYHRDMERQPEADCRETHPRTIC
ncbi:K02A2.6-like [Cordylochernes scorpioides]|uniref:RNA-directed DNA polymerase n=1 Tax=Cordylochernes scorpioides TaxID=51811 RepID=A0ABY6LTS4_9ARAC|nr:K02A2.6-like [Cordylochernes scorpioides]